MGVARVFVGNLFFVFKYDKIDFLLWDFSINHFSFGVSFFIDFFSHFRYRRFLWNESCMLRNKKVIVMDLQRTQSLILRLSSFLIDLSFSFSFISCSLFLSHSYFSFALYLINKCHSLFVFSFSFFFLVFFPASNFEMTCHRHPFFSVLLSVVHYPFLPGSPSRLELNAASWPI